MSKTSHVADVTSSLPPPPDARIRRKEQERELSIDILRGIGILIMLIDHVGLGFGFYKWSHAFHMPLFFLVSGFFFSERRALESTFGYIGKKARTLLVPYLCVGVISYFAWLLLKRDRAWYEPLVGIFLKGQEGIPIATAIWFLLCLFMTELLFILLIRLTKAHGVVSGVTVWVVSAGIYALVTFTDVWLPFCLVPAMMSLPLLWLGWRLARAKDTIREKIVRMPLPLLFVAAVAVTASIILFPAINMRTDDYGWYLPFYLNAVGATLVILNTVNWCKRIENNFVARFLSFIGRSSLVWLCVNQAGITATEILFGRFLPVEGVPFKCIAIVVVITGCAVCTLLWNLLQNKVKAWRHRYEHQDSGVNT